MVDPQTVGKPLPSWGRQILRFEISECTNNEYHIGVSDGRAQGSSPRPLATPSLRTKFRPLRCAALEMAAGSFGQSGGRLEDRRRHVFLPKNFCRSPLRFQGGALPSRDPLKSLLLLDNFLASNNNGSNSAPSGFECKRQGSNPRAVATRRSGLEVQVFDHGVAPALALRGRRGDGVRDTQNPRATAI